MFLPFFFHLAQRAALSLVWFFLWSWLALRSPFPLRYGEPPHNAFTGKPDIIRPAALLQIFAIQPGMEITGSPLRFG